MRAKTAQSTLTGRPLLLLLLREVLIVARYSLLHGQRNRTWILNTSTTPFFLMAPLVFIAHSFLGPSAPGRQAFIALTGYDNYIGYIVVPLLDATMTSTVYSHIGHALRGEQRITDLAINVLLPWLYVRSLAGRNDVFAKAAESNPVAVEVKPEWLNGIFRSDCGKIPIA